MSQAQREPWWRGGVVYQVYPRSFVDSNGDGIGDLAGLITRLDYIASLGVDAVWLNPITPSPNADWGYDVSDYCDVHPDLGSLDDVDRLVSAADARGLRVVLDLVPNHSSDQHRWFRDARSSPGAPYRDWYVWADGRRDGLPPNNWHSVFGGPAWTLDGRTRQWYLHNFLPEQPDLNWWNDEVRDAFDTIFRFWFDRGIAGFRLDVAHGIVKDRELRDNPPAADGDPDVVRRHGQKPVYNFNRPEVHDVMRRWRRVADSYDPAAVLIGETWAPDVESLAKYYGNGDDELHLAFNFDFVLSAFDPAMLRDAVAKTEAVLPRGSLPAWTASNHDLIRMPTRWAGGDERKTRCALLVLLGLRGTLFLYYGDELGMPQADVPPDRKRDQSGRDGARTPMPWTRAEGGGFTEPGIEPWLPLDVAVPTVEEQEADPASLLSFTRRLVELRRGSADLRSGAYVSLPAPDGVWSWRRGEATFVAANLSDAESEVSGVRGEVVAATDGDRTGERVDGSLSLRPWEGVIVSAGAA